MLIICRRPPLPQIFHFKILLEPGHLHSQLLVQILLNDIQFFFQIFIFLGKFSLRLLKHRSEVLQGRCAHKVFLKLGLELFELLFGNFLTDGLIEYSYDGFYLFKFFGDCLTDRVDSFHWRHYLLIQLLEVRVGTALVNLLIQLVRGLPDRKVDHFLHLVNALLMRFEPLGSIIDPLLVQPHVLLYFLLHSE